MTKFKVIKKFSLDFLGKEWKDAYINFESVTIADIRDHFPKFSSIDDKSSKAVLKGIEDITEFLKAKFVSGKGVAEDGSSVNLKADDLESLPAEVLSRALGFLSQGVTPASPKK